MTLSATALAAIVWGCVLLVGLVFAYLVVLVAREVRERRTSEPRG